MHLVDGLVDSIFIFLSLEAVVFDVVDHFKIPNTPESINKLIL